MRGTTPSKKSLIDYSKLMMNEEPLLAEINSVGYDFACAVYDMMDKLGMKPAYRKIMDCLSKGDCITQLELVNSTDLKAPTISLVLRDMEKKGLVEREKHNEDRRETYVGITEKGRKLYQRLRNGINQLQMKIVRDISDEDQKEVLRILKKISKSLK